MIHHPDCDGPPCGEFQCDGCARVVPECHIGRGYAAGRLDAAACCTCRHVPCTSCASASPSTVERFASALADAQRQGIVGAARIFLDEGASRVRLPDLRVSDLMDLIAIAKARGAA